MTSTRLIAAFSLSALLCGCSGGLDGLGTGQLQAQRTSVNTAFANADCATLTSAIQGDIAAMKAYDDNERRERIAAPVTLFRAFERLSGPDGAGDASYESYMKTKENAAALNAKLAGKGCAVFDVEREVRAAEIKDWKPVSQ